MNKLESPKPARRRKAEAENNFAARRNEKDDFLIVGIGASAGGVQALKTFFENVPADSNAAYVVILHLSPDHDSQLAEILQTVSRIPVTQVKERIHLEPNHVYVVPPNESLSMADGHIVVSPVQTVEERRAPVDIFFRTLAESHQAHAVAVVLSGTGANGSMGIKRVKERGGAAFVQNPREAEFSEMPRNSIATELIDEILNVGDIPGKIVAYGKNLGKITIPVEAEKREERQQQALREIFTQLRVRAGHDFSNYKRPTVLRRIERRVNVRELPDLPAYAAYLKENSDETNALLKDLLISVTNFFRDQAAFEFLEREIVPRILEGKKSGETIRIWVAGCATGEEAYSLAMLLAERINDKLDAPSVQIFATDIDETAIAAARSGFYTLNDAADVSPERLRRFFVKEKDGFRVRRELREMILFAGHNLLKDPPFSHLDLATCRNLLIYFNRQAQERAMETFHFALKPDAFLLLGSSESPDGAGDLYRPVSREQRVYQTRPVAPRIAYPLPDLSASFALNQPTPDNGANRERENFQSERQSYGDLHQEILEQYAPPSLIVNEDFDIVHVSQKAGRYLQISGEPSRSLFKLLHPELRRDVSTAVHQAAQRQKSVVAENLKFRVAADRTESVNVSVRPVWRLKNEKTRGFILIIFERTNDQPDAPEAVFAANEPAMRQLEESLLHSQLQYRRSIEQSDVQAEELKASNEELQAINEELRSATEELGTGKEELQSVNEELLTVNQELKIKIEELSQSVSDFQNLINSTNIGTIFLDRDSRVKLFTPLARDVFNLIPTDIGRGLSDITHRLADNGINREIEAVLENLQPVEREVGTADGKIYLMQITAYRTAEDRIGGTIITFVNITARKQAEEDLRESEKRFRAMFEQANIGIVQIAFDGRFLAVNPGFVQIIGYTKAELQKMIVRDVTPPEDFAVEEEENRRLLAGEIAGYTLEKRCLHKSGAPVWVKMTATLVRGESGAPLYTLSIVEDLTKRKRAETALGESEERFRLLVESATDYAILAFDENGLVNAWNAGAEKVFGYAEAEIIGESGAILFTSEDRENGVPEQERQNASENGSVEDERWHLRRDGSRFYASGVMTTFKDGRGFVKIARDMTDKIKTEQIKRDKEMLQKLVGAQEDERKRIARDLHDELGQLLTGLRLKLESVGRLCEDNPELRGKIDETQTLARRVDDGIDFLAWELRPAALDDLGLRAALEKYVREWSHYAGITAELLDGTNFKKMRLAPEVETNLYRIAQEALNNVHKHARAKSVEISLDRRGADTVVLIIEDDGAGFDPNEKLNRRTGIGLIGMQERAALIGGSLTVESAPGEGTTIHVRVPTAAVLEKETI